MSPLFGFTLFAVACLISAIVARKRGRSGILTFLLCAGTGFGLVVFTSSVGGTGLAAGFAAFLAPAAGLFWALAARSSEQIATEAGEHGAYGKCPFCAEPVRKEAIKCRHCGSEIPSAPSERAA